MAGRIGMHDMTAVLKYRGHHGHGNEAQLMQINSDCDVPLHIVKCIDRWLAVGCAF